MSNTLFFFNMKSIIFKTFGILFVLSIGLKSCTEHQDNIIKQTTHEIDDNIDFSPYYINKYDYVGEYHNKALDAIFTQLNQATTKTSHSLETIEKLVTTYCNENPIISTTKSLQTINIKNIAYKIHSDTIFKNQLQQDFYKQVLQLQRNTNYTSLQSLVSDINSLEMEISSSNLKETEKDLLFIATAVAKYSAYYWANKMQTKIQPPRVKTKSEDSWFNWFSSVFMPKAQKVLEADFAGAAAGAVEGFIFGGGIGSIVPGAGTVTVAITGAVADGAKGAIMGSVCEGIGINWTFWN